MPGLRVLERLGCLMLGFTSLGEARLLDAGVTSLGETRLLDAGIPSLGETRLLDAGGYESRRDSAMLLASAGAGDVFSSTGLTLVTAFFLTTGRSSRFVRELDFG
ncbi:hypothetical protein Q31b_48760 [Novipirellula aureliae]|uniref:Uncharacterized protein n=1 Tax=Novipirellula aureliae TaxID=2527966 RepID=A0A5C6DK22_9BACT|nr:hypothetical protein Q31b_48760 [Novipirellula aureliae]